MSLLTWTLRHPIAACLLLLRAVRDTIAVLANYFTRLDWLMGRFASTGKDTFPVCFLGLPMPAFVTRDPAVVQVVLKDDFDNFEKGEPFRERFEEMLGEGIFNIDGASALWATVGGWLVFVVPLFFFDGLP
jgi:hypothetical protein